MQGKEQKQFKGNREHNKLIGVMIKKLSNQMRRNFDKSASNSGIEGMTGTHQIVIGHLSFHHDKDIFQKDIEQRFNFRRSTATGILQLMEKNGLIIRKPVHYDARLKKIVLTQRGMDVHDSHHREIESMEAQLRKGLSEEEIEMFFSLAERILENAKNKP